jgi:hypothetical protein
MVDNSCRTEAEKLQNELGFLHWQFVQLSIACNPYGEFIKVSPSFHPQRSRWVGSGRSGEGMKYGKGVLGEENTELDRVADKLSRDRGTPAQHFHT